MGLLTGLNPTSLTDPSLSLSMVFHQGVRLSRPVCPKVLFLDLFSSHHTWPLYTTLHVAMVYVLTSTLMTLNSQLNSRLMVNRLRIAGSVGAQIKQGTG